ncbi:2-oxo acid dehydrogenase subunit E2 [Mycolicibacterium sp. 050158]|uniref:2-oxo acid dehydrogenase subunit E2 n=1 Tax=Mycolicibacterium sp. 050158 TaxID=3090602 RepID=UPI00299F2E70|nr:2-oxo acid dehydrogenase subunit E2 [Mycolicibacterium sp. 050158]MDX1888662.1 2-oxo acid dehydrogenase subunit E2 [Mycolicibacterium sp. 050158]
MPDLGETVTDATISRWLRFPGDFIVKDEPLVEVSTDKVDSEITAPASGRLTEIFANEGDVSPIGANLALIDDSQSATDVDIPQGHPSETPVVTTHAHLVPATSTVDAPHTNEHPAAAMTLPTGVSHTPGTPYVTPLVRRLATELHVDLTTVTGSGVGNRIRKADVLAAADTAAAATADEEPTNATHDGKSAANPYLSPLVSLTIQQRGLDISTLRGSGRHNRIRIADLSLNQRRTLTAVANRPDRTEKLTRLRKVIANRMVESLHTSAQLTTVVEADLTAINQLRGQYGAAFAAAYGTKLTFTSFFLRAAMDTLGDFPAFNASVDTADGTVTYHGATHLNVAVDTDRGLLAPVIRNADALDIAQMATAVADVADRARANTLTVDDLSGGTFTVTNTGSRGALFDTPIINQPQVAILGTGAVVARATVIRDDGGKETIDIRNMAYLALTYDHRLIDGGDAARFLTSVKARLETADFSLELTGTT